MYSELENRIMSAGFEKISSAPKIVSQLSGLGKTVTSPAARKAMVDYLKSMATKESLRQTKNIYGGYLNLLRRAPSTLYSQGFKAGGKELGAMYLNNFKNNPVGTPLALVLPKLTLYPAAGYAASKLFGEQKDYIDEV